MAKRGYLLVHALPVVDADGDLGWLLYAGRGGGPLERGLDALPERQWVWEPPVKSYWVYEAARNRIPEVVRRAAPSHAWCRACIEGEPCERWDAIEFEEYGLQPRDPREAVEDAPEDAEAEAAEAAAWWDKVKEFMREAAPAAAGMSVAEAARILDLTPPAPREQVLSAFKRATLKAHPDRPGGSDEAMKRVIAARDVLLATAA